MTRTAAVAKSTPAPCRPVRGPGSASRSTRTEMRRWLARLLEPRLRGEHGEALDLPDPDRVRPRRRLARCRRRRVRELREQHPLRHAAGAPPARHLPEVVVIAFLSLLSLSLSLSLVRSTVYSWYRTALCTTGYTARGGGDSVRIDADGNDAASGHRLAPGRADPADAGRRAQRLPVHPRTDRDPLRRSVRDHAGPATHRLVQAARESIARQRAARGRTRGRPRAGPGRRPADAGRARRGQARQGRDRSTRSSRSSATIRRTGTGGCCPRTIRTATAWTTGRPWSAASRGSAARRSIRPRSRRGCGR